MIIGLVGNGKMAKSIKDISPYEIVDMDFVKKTNVDVVLDFSYAENIKRILEYCRKHNTPLVIGTTGYSVEEENLIIDESKYIPIFKSSNYSLGFYLLRIAISSISQYLKNDYDISLIEVHHKAKKDAPSGSAKTLIEDIRNKNLSCFSLRGGSEVGTHEILILGKNEKLSLKHFADNRNVFSYGAIKACEFIKNQRKGLYSMGDLIENGYK